MLLTADFRAVMKDLGADTLELAGPDGFADPVDCLARRMGGRRLDSDAAAFSGERARLVRVHAVLADLPFEPQRGGSARLWGREWQIREADVLGMGEGQILRMTLAREEKTRGR